MSTKKTPLKKAPSNKKVAMVAPVPAKPSRVPPPSKPADQLELPITIEGILYSLGNTHAYTVISQKGNSFLVHFEGYYDHSTIKLEGGKWVIK